MTDEERKSINNAIWLCSTCHDIVDRNLSYYTVDKLKELKQDAEDYALNKIGKNRSKMALRYFRWSVAFSTTL